jgi:peptidoglycan/LPS O-acetylase OafA/YrhL
VTETTTDLAAPGAGDDGDGGPVPGNGRDAAGPGDGAPAAAAPAPFDVEAWRRRRRFRRWLTLIALGGFAVRLVYLLGWKNNGVTWSDSLYYHEGANYLADGRGYIHPFQWIYHGYTIPGADHPPAFLTLLAGFSALGFRSFLAHQLVSCVVGTLGVVGFGWAGRRIGGERVGLLAALIVAFSPNVWFHDALVMSESLVVGSLALLLWAAYRWWDRGRLFDALVFGAAVGAAALVRSESLLLGPAIALPLLWWRRSSWADAGRQLVAAGGIAVLLIAPWVGYNMARFDHPVTLSAQFDATLVSANCDDVYYGPNTGYWSRPCVEAAEPLTKPLDDASTEGIVYRRLARDYVSAHKGRAVVVAVARVGRTFGLYQPENQVDLDTVYDGKEKGLGEVGLFAWYTVAIAGAFGLVGLRRAGRPIFPIVAVVAVTALTVMVTYGATRFRFPAELALCIPAAVSLDAAVTAFVASRRRRTPEPVAEAEASPADAEAPTETQADAEPSPEPTEAELVGSLPGRASATVRFAGLDGMRAIAALGVLVCHVGLASGQVARGGGQYLARADVGVALFFILSGFLLYRPFVSARLDDGPGPGLRKYLRHRFLRIFPAYWLALTVLTTIRDVRMRDDIRTPWDFGMYYGLLQSYSRATAVGGLQQAWTLTNELAFYLLLPLWALAAAWVARRLGRGRGALAVEGMVLATAAAGTLGFRAWLDAIGANSIAGHTFAQKFVADPRVHWIVSNFHMFVPGMALALAFEWSRRRDRPLALLELIRKHPLVCWALAAVCFWAVSTQVGLGVLGSESAGESLAHELLYAAIGFLLLAPVALAGETLPRSLRWLGTRAMVTLGVLSYGIYLWHEGVTDIYRDTRDIQNGNFYLLQGWFPAMLAFVLVGSVLLAAVSYYVVERPALLLKDRDRKLFAAWQPVRLPADARVARSAAVAPA